MVLGSYCGGMSATSSYLGGQILGGGAARGRTQVVTHHSLNINHNLPTKYIYGVSIGATEDLKHFSTLEK